MDGVGAANGIAYELTLFSSPNTPNVVHVRLERLGTSFVYTVTLGPASSSQLPESTIFLAPRAWRCNNATALAVRIDVANIYIESDY